MRARQHPRIRSLGTARALVVLAAAVGLLAACGTASPDPSPTPTPAPPRADGGAPDLPTTPEPGPGVDGSADGPVTAVSLDSVVPRPVSVVAGAGVFRLTASARIVVEPATPEMTALGLYLAGRLGPATGFPLPVAPASAAPAAGDIHLSVPDGADPALGEEGYQLQITETAVTLSAARPAGIFLGLQTIRQLLPPGIERDSVQAGPWLLAEGSVRDHPRFVWRGAMLDLARHFFSVEVVKRFVDLLVYYKMNRLHLHLSDDQGWRIAIAAWPELTSHGGSTEVGGGPGGFLSKEQYADLVAYAQARYVTLVPEIDVPGHTNAALSSYPELSCNGMAPPLYTGVDVGFSTLCTGSPVTDRFMSEVIAELAAMTPGPYLHLGGDEAKSTNPAEYVTFISAVQKLVQARGKAMIGWEEVAAIDDLATSSIVQHWQNVPLTLRAKQQGAKIIMSPSSRAYLDMKYDASTGVGGTWAGFIDEKRAYEWDPATQVPGVGEADVLGIEAPLWSETISTREEMELLTLPRLAGHAEIAWSPAAGRSWDEYQTRIGAQGPRLTAMGVNAYRSARIPWR